MMALRWLNKDGKRTLQYLVTPFGEFMDVPEETAALAEIKDNFRISDGLERPAVVTQQVGSDE